MAKRFLVLIALLMLGFFIAGCAEGDKSSSVVNPNPDVFSPTGSISGVVFDICANKPVQGAVVSVAYGGKVHSVTTSSNGAYSFANVPAQELFGDDLAWDDNENNEDENFYTVTCDLTKVTGYGYAVIDYAQVYFSTLEDGTANDQDDVESGSGSNTPVNNLAANLDFEVGPPTASLAGTIYDVSTGRALTAATVALYRSGYGGNVYLSSATVSATGTYSFANILPGYYKLMVTKAGYEYAALQASNTVGSPSCNLVSVSCEVGCAQALANVNVNMIANPAKDKTVPYIVTFAAGSETDVIDGDDFPALDQELATLVATFSEGMQSSRTLKDAVALTATCTVTVTSGGTTTNVHSHYTETILTDYAVTMTSAGVMTITPEFRLAADWATRAGYGSTATFTYDTAATYTVTLTPNSMALTDLSYIPWSVGTSGGNIAVGGVDAYGFLHAFAEAYQDYFILGGTMGGAPSYNIAITAGE